MAYRFNPPEKNTLSTQPTNSDKGTVYRIYNIFKPTVVLDELSLPKGDNRKDRKPEDIASLAYPLVKINDYFISINELEYMSIDCTDFLPRITLQASFLYPEFVDREMPKDGDIISIAIRNKSDALNIIRNDYVITGVTVSPRRANVNAPSTVTFFGELFVPGLKSFMGSKSYVGTSMNALKKIAKVLQLGFNTNDDKTNDKQVWYNIDTPETFIKDVTLKAWRDENSFYKTWIDIWYNLNFVNVQKQLLSSESEIDTGVLLDNVDIDWTWGPTTDQDQTYNAPKVFSNYPGYRTSSFFIKDWKPNNRSSNITFQFGTSTEASFYEHIDVLYEDSQSERYWNLDIAPAYDPAKLDDYILLRGRTRWDPSINTGELARANYDYTELYKKAPWLGIQYTINNPSSPNTEWSGNHHENYLRAQAHNTINNVELDKLNLEITVQGTNMNVIRGDKIPVVLVETDRISNQMIDKRAVTSERKNAFYSGWYMVKGFNLSWTQPSQGSIISSFSQKFVLTRREWPPPIPVSRPQSE
jgi:hypothetical protein